MIIHFGMRLDGMQPLAPATAAGELTLGPTRLLAMLETELGLPPVRTRPGEALLAYQQCLAEVDDFARFYHASFAVDALGVARTLMSWRSQWHEAGWRGTFAHPVSQRLADLAAVEHLAADRVPLTPGQRVMRAQAALASGLRTQIGRIVLHDPLTHIPATWRALLEHFDCEPAPGVKAQAHASPGTDLHRVQQTLLELAGTEEGTERKRVRLAGDTSFILVRGVSRDLTAQAIGEYLLKTRALTETVVIAERDGIIVDNALERVGLARAGFQHYSRFRAVTQVLKLCLGLLWEPVSPQLLLQFLVHPVAPLPDHVRSRLADAVASEPGVGGHAWREALAAIAERMKERFAASDTAIREQREDIGYWLECERFAPQSGVPIEIVLERTQRCATWLARRLHALDDASEVDLFAAAQAQSEALLAALTARKTHGAITIGRIALEQLVDEVSGHAPDPGTFAEAGHVRAATDPATITSVWPTVVWWDLEPQSASARYPWSRAEQTELVANGVMLPSIEELIRARTEEWLRPITHAEHQLILVIHERDQGHHPLIGTLMSAVENWCEVRIEEALLDNGAHPRIPALDIATRALEVKPLPAPRRWWQLPTALALAPRAVESYSSLQKLIDYPHEWVLRYAAGLKPGRASDLARGGLLYGNLAHRLFESFFSAHPEWASLNDQALREWLAPAVRALVAKEGAVLSEPGAGVAREQVLSTLENAFLRLLEHLRGAGIESVQAEHWIEAPFKNISIRGGIDLLARDRNGRSIVVDIKWSGQDYRGQELEQGRALQLATYAYMCRASGATRHWPAHAYFIVATGNMVAPGNDIFPDALVYTPAEAEPLERLWQRIESTIEWRWAQLARGAIEVNAEGTYADAESEPPAHTIALAAEPDRFDEYTWLTGWEEGV